MKSFYRFGRRIPMPSSLQVSRELRMLSADWDIRARCSEEDGLPNIAAWDEIMQRRQLRAVKLN